MESLTSVKEILRDTHHKMVKAEDALKKEFRTLRTGRASTAMVEGIHVDYYGAITPLKQLATISIPEPRLVSIQPWDLTAVDSVIKGIHEADLGLNPVSDGKIIRIQVPELTDERRQEITKIVRKYAEETRISIRSARKEANNAIKNLEKEGIISEDESRMAHDDVQKVTDKSMSIVDELLKHKEDEIHQI